MWHQFLRKVKKNQIPQPLIFKWLPENHDTIEQTAVAAVRPWRIRQSIIHRLWTTANSLFDLLIGTTKFF